MLTIEMIPRTTYGVNARTLCSKDEWDRVRRIIYQRAGYVCEICGGTGPEHPVECHEVWVFEEETKIQRLEGLIALCPTCHQVKHINHSIMSAVDGSRGALTTKTRLMRHMMKVNEWSFTEAATHLHTSKLIQEKRGIIKWTVDVSYLEQVKKPEPSYEFNGGFKL